AAISVAYGGGVGAGSARRHGRPALSLGRAATAITPGLCQQVEDRARARGPGRAECLWTARYVRERTRVVQRLVRRVVLREFTATKSAGACGWRETGIARRLVAAPREEFEVLHAVEHSS